jgi:hypothetical protein
MLVRERSSGVRTVIRSRIGGLNQRHGNLSILTLMSIFPTYKVVEKIDIGYAFFAYHLSAAVHAISARLSRLSLSCRGSLNLIEEYPEPRSGPIP